LELAVATPKGVGGWLIAGFKRLYTGTPLRNISGRGFFLACILGQRQHEIEVGFFWPVFLGRDSMNLKWVILALIDSIQTTET
jgi:hypothetical protein